MQWNISNSWICLLEGSEDSGVPKGGGFGGFKPSEIPKALQNRAKLNPIVKNVKNCWI